MVAFFRAACSSYVYIARDEYGLRLGKWFRSFSCDGDSAGTTLITPGTGGGSKSIRHGYVQGREPRRAAALLRRGETVLLGRTEPGLSARITARRLSSLRAVGPKPSLLPPKCVGPSRPMLSLLLRPEVFPTSASIFFLHGMTDFTRPQVQAVEPVNAKAL